MVLGIYWFVFQKKKKVTKYWFTKLKALKIPIEIKSAKYLNYAVFINQSWLCSEVSIKHFQHITDKLKTQYSPFLKCPTLIWYSSDININYPCILSLEHASAASTWKQEVKNLKNGDAAIKSELFSLNCTDLLCVRQQVSKSSNSVI